MAKSNDAGWSDPVAAPEVPEGFMLKEEGLAFEGPVIARSVGEYGPYYVIKILKGDGSYKVGDEVKAIKPGLNLAISEINALRPLAELMKKGPLMAKATFKGKVGQAWDVELRTKAAF